MCVCVYILMVEIGAPMGTGGSKLGGNYAPTFGPIMRAKKQGYALTLHLDSKTRTHIDEFSTSNFVALTYPGKHTRKIIKQNFVANTCFIRRKWR